MDADAVLITVWFLPRHVLTATIFGSAGVVGWASVWFLQRHFDRLGVVSRVGTAMLPLGCMWIVIQRLVGWEPTLAFWLFLVGQAFAWGGTVRRVKLPPWPKP